MEINKMSLLMVTNALGKMKQDDMRMNGRTVVKRDHFRSGTVATTL